MPFSDDIRMAITLSGKSMYRISQESGVDRSTLSRFINSTGGLSTSALDRIAACIGLSVACTSGGVTSSLEMRLLRLQLALDAD